MKNKEKIISCVKQTGRFVCSSSIGAVVCGIGRAVLPPGVNAIVKSGMLIGGLLIGGMIGEQVDTYVDKQIDKAVKSTEEISSEIKKNIEIIREKEKETTE